MNLNITTLEPERVIQFVKWWGDPQKEALLEQIAMWRKVALIKAADLKSQDLDNANFSTAALEKLEEAERFLIAIDVLKGVDTQQLIARIEL